MKKKAKKKNRRNAEVTTGKKRAGKPKRKAASKDDFLGRLNGVIRIVGDIESPVVPIEDWEYD